MSGEDIKIIRERLFGYRKLGILRDNDSEICYPGGSQKIDGSACRTAFLVLHMDTVRKVLTKLAPAQFAYQVPQIADQIKDFPSPTLSLNFLSGAWETSLNNLRHKINQHHLVTYENFKKLRFLRRGNQIWFPVYGLPKPITAGDHEGDPRVVNDYIWMLIKTRSSPQFAEKVRAIIKHGQPLDADRCKALRNQLGLVYESTDEWSKLLDIVLKDLGVRPVPSKKYRQNTKRDLYGSLGMLPEGDETTPIDDIETNALLDLRPEISSRLLQVVEDAAIDGISSFADICPNYRTYDPEYWPLNGYLDHILSDVYCSAYTGLDTPLSDTDAETRISAFCRIGVVSRVCWQPGEVKGKATYEVNFSSLRGRMNGETRICEFVNHRIYNEHENQAGARRITCLMLLDYLYKSTSHNIHRLVDMVAKDQLEEYSFGSAKTHDGARRYTFIVKYKGRSHQRQCLGETDLHHLYDGMYQALTGYRALLEKMGLSSDGSVHPDVLTLICRILDGDISNFEIVTPLEFRFTYQGENRVYTCKDKNADSRYLRLYNKIFPTVTEIKKTPKLHLAPTRPPGLFYQVDPELEGIFEVSKFDPSTTFMVKEGDFWQLRGTSIKLEPACAFPERPNPWLIAGLEFQRSGRDPDKRYVIISKDQEETNPAVTLYRELS